MKLRSLLIALVLLTTANLASAQKKSVETVIIQTSAVCEMCKATIEEGMVYVKGVREADLSLEDFKVTVTYRADKTDPEKIKQAIAKLGYTADDVKPLQKDFDKLHECCKAPHD
jgi:periplasmic mercuric ion binding protein